MKQHTTFRFFPIVILCLIVCSCGSKKSPQPEIVSSPEKMDKKAGETISALLQSVKDSLLHDTIKLNQPEVVQFIYSQKQNEPLWSSRENWLPYGDSLVHFIINARQWGLFSENYHFARLDFINKQFIADSTGKGARRDANEWATADILLTDAAAQIFCDVKLGRLQNDSVMKRTDSMLTKEFISGKLNELEKTKSLFSVLSSLEPRHKGYHELKAGIKKFLDSSDFAAITVLPYPYRDTAGFKLLLTRRLTEKGFYKPDSIAGIDTAKLRQAIKKFQEREKIEADGKAGQETIRRLNTSDAEKFYRIAISLDRYKMLPEIMPQKYIWVNLPAFQLRIIEDDTVRLTSRVVVGKPHTRTPVLTSSVYEMITYPKWTIPASIIEKEILPAQKRNPGYLRKKGYGLYNKEGEEVNPDSVDWSKYTRRIPYNVIQGSGDANALGVMKFNFSNKYQVYMHDTNERYLFSREFRSLSHGCVRVQEWSSMAGYFLDNEEKNFKTTEAFYAMKDSVSHWLKQKEKHTVPLKNRVPVYFRYFTCEGKGGSIVFHNDIYGEDKLLKEKYYGKK